MIPQVFRRNRAAAGQRTLYVIDKHEYYDV